MLKNLPTSIILTVLFLHSGASFSENKLPLPPLVSSPASSSPGSVQELFNLDYHFISTIQGRLGSALHHQLFNGPVDGAIYKKYLDDRITSAKTGDCGNGAFACFISSFPHVIFYPPSSLTSDVPQIERVMAIIHEARHTEAAHGNYLHVPCAANIPYLFGSMTDSDSSLSSNSIVGTLNCDNNLTGAYGISLVMLKNVQYFCTNCTDKIKQDAEMWSDGTLRSIDVAEERKALFKDINDKRGIPWNPQSCSYTVGSYGNQQCPSQTQFLLLYTDSAQSTTTAGCYDSLTALNNNVMFFQYEGKCK